MNTRLVLSVTVLAATLMAGIASAGDGHKAFGKLDITAAIASLPKTSDKPFVDVRLLENGEIGVRVFRVYNPVPRHSHTHSSTYLNIVSGRGIVRIDGGEPFEAGVGDMVFWERNVDHEVVKILEHPFTFLVIDAPVRQEGDVHRYKP